MSEETIVTQKAEEPKTDYKVLREQLTLLAKEFKACEDIYEAIDEINDKSSFRKAYSKTLEDVVNKFGIEVGDSDKIEELESDLEDAERERDTLQDELDEYKQRFGKISTLHDEYKVLHFVKHKDNYAEWEIQMLLENGKKILQSHSF